MAVFIAFWSTLVVLLLVVGGPLLWFSLFRGRPEPFRDELVAVIENRTLRIRGRRNVRQITALMDDDDLLFLDDLLREVNRGVMPVPQDGDRARQIIARAVTTWLATEGGQAWRASNWR